MHPQAEQRANNLLILTHAASSYGREMPPKFLLRRPNGTIAETEATLRDESRDTETELGSLANWFKSQDCKPFSATKAARAARSSWTMMSQDRAEEFISDAIFDGHLVTASKGRTGADLYVPSAETLGIDPFDTGGTLQ